MLPQLGNEFSACYDEGRLIIFCARETVTWPILNKVNLAHDQSFLSRIHFNIIFPSIPRYTLFSLPQVSPTKPRTYPSTLPYVLHARSVSFRDLITRIIFDEGYRSQSACSLLQSPVTSSALGPKIFLSTLFSNTPSLYVRDQV